MEALESFFTNLPAWLIAATALVTSVSAITAMTPTTSDDKVISAILKVLNILSLNVGKNKNADDQ